jgi:hypothetical protein
MFIFFFHIFKWDFSIFIFYTLQWSIL